MGRGSKLFFCSDTGKARVPSDDAPSEISRRHYLSLFYVVPVLMSGKIPAAFIPPPPWGWQLQVVLERSPSSLFRKRLCPHPVVQVEKGAYCTPMQPS